MKVFVLICDLLFAAAVGYFVIDRLGRFLDRGGISPYWDEEEERLAVCEKKELLRSDSILYQEGCNNSNSKVV